MEQLTVNRLASLKKRMSKAYDSGEWQVLAELDRECQHLVAQIIRDDPRAMFEDLRGILGFYAELIANCEVQRGQYASEVKQLRKVKSHHKAYANVSNCSTVNN